MYMYMYMYRYRGVSIYSASARSTVVSTLASCGRRRRASGVPPRALIRAVRMPAAQRRPLCVHQRGNNPAAVGASHIPLMVWSRTSGGAALGSVALRAAGLREGSGHCRGPHCTQVIDGRPIVNLFGCLRLTEGTI